MADLQICSQNVQSYLQKVCLHLSSGEQYDCDFLMGHLWVLSSDKLSLVVLQCHNYNGVLLTYEHNFFINILSFCAWQDMYGIGQM